MTVAGQGQGGAFTFFCVLSWWEGCFSCWAEGEADRLLRPAMKPLPPPPEPLPPPAAAAPPPPPPVCREVFWGENWEELPNSPLISLENGS